MKYSLHTMDTEELKGIYEVEEGLEHRVKKRSGKQALLRNTWSFETKRYTWTRLQRMNTHILTKRRKPTLSAC
ncbi:nucleotidyltransferase family protein [Bacillus licheniformis]|nr:nucleotidyltransferase family protein [Bacillus licheniformis]